MKGISNSHGDSGISPTGRHLNVLFVSGSFPPMKCGVGNYTKRLAEQMGKHTDISVSVLTDEAARNHPVIPNVTIQPIVKGWRLSDFNTILDAIRNFGPDVIHIQFPTQGYGKRKLPWFLACIFTSKKIPIVQTWHEYYPMGGLMNIPNGIAPGGLVAVRPNYMERMPAWFRRLNKRKTFRFIPNVSSIPFVPLTDSERSAIRSRFGRPDKHLIAYFGFVYPPKNVEALFEICDPHAHHLVLICDLNPADSYHNLILGKIHNTRWEQDVTVTGYLTDTEVGEILSAADGVILPFRNGGGSWNTSIHAAESQGTFVLVTSQEENGYDPSRNIYFAQPGNIKEMRTALEKHVRQRKEPMPTVQPSTWEAVVGDHLDLYRSILGQRPSN